MMTFDAVKERLHEYIEHADENKILAIYTLISDEIEQQKFVYDEATLNMLETRKHNMLNGIDKTYSLEQTIENMVKYRNNHGI